VNRALRLQILTSLGILALLMAEGQTADCAVGVSVTRDGKLSLAGRPLRALGVNYFNAFIRTLHDGNDTSYNAGFSVLAAHHIRWARFAACGFWPVDMKLYQTDREQYFRRMDGVIRSAERHGVGLVPSLFWHMAMVPDLVGEPCSAWGDPASKTHVFMRQYNLLHGTAWNTDTPAQSREMLALQHPPGIDLLSAHLYTFPKQKLWDIERLEEVAADARALGRPLMIGEFQIPEAYVDQADTPAIREAFRSFLRRADAAGIPLAAVWVFDFPWHDKELCNITHDNSRGWQLDEMGAMNLKWAGQANY
jgi:hypothetical protein